MRSKIAVDLGATLMAMLCLVSVSQAQSIKVPYVSMSGFQWPLWLAERAGTFTKHNLDVQLIYIPGGSLIIQTMLSGEVGIASQSPTSVISAWGNGADLVLVAGGIERVLNVLMVSPKITKPEELRGKRLGISRFGSLSDWSLREALRPYKLRAGQDVTLVQMGGLGERMAGLTTGLVDGAMLNPDQEYQVVKLGYHKLLDMQRLPANVPTQGIVGAKDFVRHHRDTVKRFLRAYGEGIKMLKTNKELSVATLARYLKINDAELLSRTYDVYRSAFESIPYVLRDGVIQTLETMPEITAKNPKLNVDQVIDNSIMAELEKEGYFRDLYANSVKR